MEHYTRQPSWAFSYHLVPFDGAYGIVNTFI